MRIAEVTIGTVTLFARPIHVGRRPLGDRRAVQPSRRLRANGMRPDGEDLVIYDDLGAKGVGTAVSASAKGRRREAAKPFHPKKKPRGCVLCVASSIK